MWTQKNPIQKTSKGKEGAQNGVKFTIPETQLQKSSKETEHWRRIKSNKGAWFKHQESQMGPSEGNKLNQADHIYENPVQKKNKKLWREGNPKSKVPHNKILDKQWESKDSTHPKAWKGKPRTDLVWNSVKTKSEKKKSKSEYILFVWFRYKTRAEPNVLHLWFPFFPFS